MQLVCNTDTSCSPINKMYILEFLKWLLLERQAEGRAKSQHFCYESYTCTFLPNCVQVCDNLTLTLVRRSWGSYSKTPEYIALSTTVDGRYTVYVVFATLIHVTHPKIYFCLADLSKNVGVNWFHEIKLWKNAYILYFSSQKCTSTSK
jgi:hypothetical protein